MDDMEKNRVEYVSRLEEKIQYLQSQVSELKPLVEKWKPVVNGEISSDGSQVRVTLAFGGKRTTATVSTQSFANNSPNDITFSVSNTLAESLLVDRIREVIEPEIQRLKAGVQSLSGVGKW